MDRILVQAYAKINIALGITKLREDGYHELDMLNASVNIFDQLVVTKRLDERIVCEMGRAKCLDTNTAVKAAKLFMQQFHTNGVDIHIDKHIPFCGGLGGSSADAAGTLRAMQRLYEVSDESALELVAGQCSADVPYMLSGGYARVQGVGERVTPFTALKAMPLVIIKGGRVSTKKAYAEFDCDAKFSHMDIPLVKEAICQGEWGKLDDLCENSLQASAIRLCRAVEWNIKLLSSFQPIYARMTGSGSAVFGVFESLERAKEVATSLKSKVEYCHFGTTIPYGIRYLG